MAGKRAVSCGRKATGMDAAWTVTSPPGNQGRPHNRLHVGCDLITFKVFIKLSETSKPQTNKKNTTFLLYILRKKYERKLL